MPVRRQNSVRSEINHLGAALRIFVSDLIDQHACVTLLLAGLKTEYCSRLCHPNLLKINIRPRRGNFDDPHRCTGAPDAEIFQILFCLTLTGS